jgi:hypothetical protein
MHSVLLQPRKLTDGSIVWDVIARVEPCSDSPRIRFSCAGERDADALCYALRNVAVVGVRIED